MAVELIYRDLYVVAPRAVAAKWQHEPWATLLAAAERGEDGLSILRGRPRLWQGQMRDSKPNPPDVAYFAQGQHDWTDKTVLFQQNW